LFYRRMLNLRVTALLTEGGGADLEHFSLLRRVVRFLRVAVVSFGRLLLRGWHHGLKLYRLREVDGTFWSRFAPWLRFRPCLWFTLQTKRVPTVRIRRAWGRKLAGFGLQCSSECAVLSKVLRCFHECQGASVGVELLLTLFLVLLSTFGWGVLGGVKCGEYGRGSRSRGVFLPEGFSRLFRLGCSLGSFSVRAAGVGSTWWGYARRRVPSGVRLRPNWLALPFGVASTSERTECNLASKFGPSNGQRL